MDFQDGHKSLTRNLDTRDLSQLETAEVVMIEVEKRYSQISNRTYLLGAQFEVTVDHRLQLPLYNNPKWQMELGEDVLKVGSTPRRR